MALAQPVRVGVIGVGVLGRHHTRLYANSADAELVGVYDVSPESAAKVAAEYGCAAFNEIDALVGQVDAVSVAVPTDLHFDVVSRLLEQDKHVLVEKPLTATVEQGRALVALARKRDVVLQVGHVERFNPVITYLEEKIDHPRFIESHRLAGYPPPRPGMLPRGTEVGVVFDLMIHDIDIILSLVKSPVVRIDSVGLCVLSATEDIANARIAFANGCVANLTASRVSPEPMRKIRVFQQNAYLSLDYGEKCGEIATIDGANVHREAVPIDQHDALERELADFLAASAGESAAPRVPGEQGLKALEIADTIARQIAESQ
ncbi:MAG: putative dehydrogenase [Verrucomicrobiales bacterium]|jgi:predicted dehydrogenase